MKTSVVIPARLKSTRLPNKMLADLGGHPVLWHTWSQTKKMSNVDEILILTDADEIFNQAVSWGAQVLMTSPECSCGTERTFSVLSKIKGDFILLVQGDEPFVEVDLLDRMVQEAKQNSFDIITPVYPLKSIEEINNPNLVKVVRQKSGRALYFSRSPIPFVRGVEPSEWIEASSFYGHLGLYGYRKDFLKNYDKIPSSYLEKAECLEQLRFLEAGFSIQTIETNYRSIAIDTPEDLIKAKKFLNNE